MKILQLNVKLFLLPRVNKDQRPLLLDHMHLPVDPEEELKHLMLLMVADKEELAEEGSKAQSQITVPFYSCR